jgi:uncharacterized protein (TIGR03905 family)
MKENQMRYIYKTERVCSPEISFDINDDIITNIGYTGGCDGNLQLIQKLVDGMSVTEIEDKCSGIQCGQRGTSCGDQLSKAVRKAQEAQMATQQR